MPTGSVLWLCLKRRRKTAEIGQKLIESACDSPVDECQNILWRFGIGLASIHCHFKDTPGGDESEKQKTGRSPGSSEGCGCI